MHHKWKNIDSTTYCSLGHMGNIQTSHSFKPLCLCVCVVLKAAAATDAIVTVGVSVGVAEGVSRC